MSGKFIKTDAKKIRAAALVEGEKTIRFIFCDVDESRGYPIAMLFWPSKSDMRVAFQKLDPSFLSRAHDKDFDYFYSGEPIPISKMVLNHKPSRRSGWRLGFHFLAEPNLGQGEVRS